MKKKLIAAIACAVCACFVVGNTAYALELGTTNGQEATAFWKKKDKEVPTEDCKPEAKPAEENTPANAPVETQEVPKQEKQDNAPTAGAIFVKTAPGCGGCSTCGIEYVPGINEQIEKTLA